MKKRLLGVILWIGIGAWPLIGWAQQLEGTVTDMATGEPLIGVSVQLAGTSKGTVSDINGKYALHAPAGFYQIEFSYMGYSSESAAVTLVGTDTAVVDIRMNETAEMLQDVVVSVGRFEQNMNEVTVSMELLKGVQIKQQAPVDVTSALRTLSGVEIVDKQPSIRGGGGWTYSVGARSQILLDGMSVLNPKTGEVNWNSIPMENISQIEVIKGASSVLYGSSALNGVINIRTERPGLTPQTHIGVYLGVYGKYKNDAYNYTNNSFWSADQYKVSSLGRYLGLKSVRQPIYDGLDFSHTRRIGHLDFSLSGNLMTDEGYRQQAYNQRAHIGLNLDYHQPMPTGIYMDYGVNLSYMGNQYGDFFVWRSPYEPTKPSPVTNMGREENVFTADPFFNYTNSDTGISHKVRGRVHIMGDNTTTPSATVGLTDWLGSQSVNIDQSVNLLRNMFFDSQGHLNSELDLSAFIPIIVAFNNGDYTGMANNAVEMVNGLFPNMKTSDMMDVVGMAMQQLNVSEERMKVDHTYDYYIDYQFAKQWDNSARITAGATWNHIDNHSAITGYHVSDNAAAYLQYDQKFLNCLSVSAGMRLEYYRIDNHYKEATQKIGSIELPLRPVFRAGLNWQAAQATWLRASVGQGYRNPSITEKYARKDIGGVGVYPNTELRPESGFNAEIGLRQGYKWGKLQGVVDFAAFYTEYWNMIEFQFGLFNNTTYAAINSTDSLVSMMNQLVEKLADIKDINELKNAVSGASVGIGAQFVNVSHARIYGVELETNGEYEFFRDSKLRYSLSYLFSEPEDADWKERNEREDQYTDPMQMKTSSNSGKYLKYRNKHTVKLGLDFSYKILSLGANFAWRSKMLAVDYLMMDERDKQERDLLDMGRDLLFGEGLVSEIMTGNQSGYTLKQYWDKHNTNYCTLDLHLAVQCTKWLDVQFMVNNVLNTEYSYRPMALAAPRSYVCKLNFNF